MKKALLMGFIISFVSGICQASSSNFSCEVVQINDETAVMYFELESGSFINGNFKAKKIQVGSLGFSGKEVQVKNANPVYIVKFQDPESQAWSFEINYTSGIGKLIDSKGYTQVLSNCVWQLGLNPFEQPDIAL